MVLRLVESRLLTLLLFLLLLLFVFLVQSINLGCVFSHGLDDEWEGKVQNLVSPGEFQSNIRSHNVVASVQSSSKALLLSFLNEEFQQAFSNLLFLRISSGLDGVLVNLVLLRQFDRLSPSLRNLVDVGSNSSEFKQIVVLELLSQSNLIKVVKVINGASQRFVVFLFNVQLVEGFVDSLDVLLLHRDEVRLNQWQVSKSSGDLHNFSVVNLANERYHQIVNKSGLFCKVILNSSVADIQVVNLGNNVSEKWVLPRLGWVIQHSHCSIVKFVVLGVQEDKFRPLGVHLDVVNDLGDGDSVPLSLQEIHQLAFVVFGVQDSQFGEHSIV
mmetsp:Transcript_13569/g.18774  ORF Transcript_13569/g.18774 Transcript_13569/m.18774 type:complete len:328 (+) Transcript_13569:296-1279(+)